MCVTTFARAALLLAALASPVVAQTRSTVRLVHPSPEVFAFHPARVTVRPGELLVFSVESGGPYVIGFEPADLGPRERALLDAAMPDRTASLRSAVLNRSGSHLQLVLPALPKGSYRFAAVTHLAYRMTGVLVVP